MQQDFIAVKSVVSCLSAGLLYHVCFSRYGPGVVASWNGEPTLQERPLPYSLYPTLYVSQWKGHFCGVVVDGHTPSHTNKAKMCWCRWTRRPGMRVYQKTSNIGKAICVVEILNAQKSIVWANNKNALSNSLMRLQVIAFQIAYIWSPISITCLSQKKKITCVCQDTFLIKLDNMQRIKLSIIISLKRSHETREVDYSSNFKPVWN
jgi:hypothetical protein